MPNLTKQQVEEILRENKIHGYGIRVAKTKITWEDEGIPVLPSLLSVCKKLGVSPDKLEIDHTGGGEGCPTCGYGGECTFDFTVRLK